MKWYENLFTSDAWLRAAGTTSSVKALLAGAAPPRPREKKRAKAS